MIEEKKLTANPALPELVKSSGGWWDSIGREHFAVYRRIDLDEEPEDAQILAYQHMTAAERLRILETLRREYWGENYDAEPRSAAVYHYTKRIRP